MLEAFLKVAAEKYAESDLLDAMTARMSRLPVDELRAIVTGQPKLAHLSVCDDASVNWLAKFEGTPLHAKALELAQREIDTEAAKLEQRSSRELAEEAQRRSWELESRQRDSINLHKRMLELELSQLMAAGEPDALGAAPLVADPAAAKVAAACGVTPWQLVGMRKQANFFKNLTHDILTDASLRSHLPGGLADAAAAVRNVATGGGGSSAMRGLHNVRLSDVIREGREMVDNAARGGSIAGSVPSAVRDAAERATLGDLMNVGKRVVRATKRRKPAASVPAPAAAPAVVPAAAPAVVPAAAPAAAADAPGVWHDLGAFAAKHPYMSAGMVAVPGVLGGAALANTDFGPSKQKTAAACGVTPEQLAGMRKQAIGFGLAAKGLAKALSSGWAGGSAKSIAAGKRGAGGFSGALSRGAQYYGRLAKTNPGIATTFAALPVAAAGGAGYMLGN
jgi:hypothetical protein